jgi:hypothetical protein
MKEDIEPRIRTLRTLWAAMSMSIVVYYVLTFFVSRPEDREPNETVFLVLLAAAVTTTLVSFLVKNKLLNQAVERQQVQLVQQGYIVTWALTEVAALMGLLDFFASRNRYYYVLFIIGAIGMLLHFPRREHVLNAAFNHSGF